MSGGDVLLDPRTVGRRQSRLWPDRLPDLTPATSPTAMIESRQRDVLSSTALLRHWTNWTSAAGASSKQRWLQVNDDGSGGM